MHCPECQSALRNILHGIYRAGCTECEARALARSPAFAESAKAEAITVGYRDALMRVFGEHWRTAHVRVKFWADR